MAEKKISIKIDGIEIIEKKLSHVVDISDNQEFKFEVKAQVNADLEKDLTLVIAQVNITKEEETLILASLTIACGFSIPDSASHFPKDEKGIKIPKEIDTMLRGLTISTLRGILFSELRGTILHKAYMPIILQDKMVIADSPIIAKPAI